MASAVVAGNCNWDIITLIRYYSNIRPKYSDKDICSIINNHHKLSLTVRKLRYVRSKQNIHREVDDNILKDVVENELTTSRSCVGYRQMTEIINLRYNLNVAKDKIRRILLAVDPEGVQERRRTVLKRRIYDTKGPNEIYHIDGNDKLKMWGFCIHGGVDGFSRKLLWLKVATSNNDPLIIGNYYLQFVKENNVAPKFLRMDKGTENIYCQDLQVIFTGNQDSFRYGPSTRNQKIEAFWSRLKKFRLSWWKTFFQKMLQDGVYRPELDTHQEVLVFCFLPVIQIEFNEFCRTWNSRNVRQSSGAPGGKPDLLFSVPETVGCESQGVIVDEVNISLAEAVIGFVHHPVWKNKDLYDLLTCYVHIHNLRMPLSADDALQLYGTLLTMLVNDNLEF